MSRHPLFTRRHYAAIAEVLRVTNNENNPASNARWLVIRENLVDLFAEDNPSFNAYKFKEATEAEGP